jgi:MFS family permease
VPALIASAWSIRLAAAHAWTFAACALATLVSMGAYFALSPRIEAAAAPEPLHAPPGGTPKILRTLVLLFAIDSLGSGFLNSALLAYWFFERYAMTEEQVALLFAAARLLNALSHVLAAWLSRRIGLVNTMVATHLPSSLLLMSAPLAPGAAGASALFLGREALVEMDVPTRQSYMMAIVPAHQRTLVSSVTNVTRLIGWAVGPVVAGALMQGVASAAPLVAGGSLKILYDLLLYRAFHRIRAPEERRGTINGGGRP